MNKREKAGKAKAAKAKAKAKAASTQSVEHQKIPSSDIKPMGTQSFALRIWRSLEAWSMPIVSLATVIGASAAVISIPGVWQYFNSGQLEVSIGDDVVLNQDSPTYFFFKTPSDATDAFYLLPVQFRVTNASSAHEDKIGVSVRYDRKFQRAFLPEEAFKLNPTRPAKEQQHEVKQSDTYDYVNYSLSFLSPRAHQQFTEGAFATRIAYDASAPILFASGVGLDVTIDTYSQQDIHRSWDIRYRGLGVQKDEDILKVLKEWYAKQIALDIRKSSGFWGYIPKLLAQKEVRMYAYAPDFQYISKLNAFLPSASPEHVVGVAVKPYSWKLLFESF